VPPHMTFLHDAPDHSDGRQRVLNWGSAAGCRLQIHSVFILAPLDPGKIVIAGGRSIDARKAELRAERPNIEVEGSRAGMGFLERGQPASPQQLGGWAAL